MREKVWACKEISYLSSLEQMVPSPIILKWIQAIQTNRLFTIGTGSLTLYGWISLLSSKITNGVYRNSLYGG
ncbi:hypothetical protein SAMN05421852_108119 [Thermoflavimicrobium dichotomicum]|uniref:Uncharacterized protein n=1 Tax=Thermoflavimicrobium dichotomicum TaxID=46223 RepID=A0A1I3QWJ0_9BACL|nr:hypothetical protein SAMN05421852_108119 [Thermoflavimicrobium dichotomicum]